MSPSHRRSTEDPSERAPRRTSARPVSTFGVLAATVVVAVTGAVDGRVLTDDHGGEQTTSVRPVAATRPIAAAGRADGVVPPGTTVFDDVPAVSRLDPALLRSLRRAATDAKADAVTLEVNSGWRSRKYQQQLLDEAVATYGSKREAARWVATPDTSPHVSGNAVDIGRAGARWLSARGDAYGLCTVYRNEAWHFERRPAAIAGGCPAMYADPAQDPRMRA